MSRMRVNVCCLIGAVVALLCLALPWSTSAWEPGSYKEHFYLSDKVYTAVGGEPRLIITMIVLIVGGVASLFTPLGGFVQFLAVANYLRELGPRIGTVPMTGPQVVHFYFDIGFYLAIWSTLLTLLSATVPFGFGYSGLYSPFSKRTLSWKHRLLVFGLE